MRRRDIRLLVPGLAIDPADPFGRSLGGSETAGLQLAAALCQLDQTVACFCDVPQATTWGRVNLFPVGQFGGIYTTVPADLTIVQRTALPYHSRGCSKVNLLWVHDLLFARRKQEMIAGLHSVDRIVTVSHWQRDQYRRVCPDLPESLFLPLRNGVDLALIDRIRQEHRRRDPHLIMCCARPERGTDVLLLHLLPKLIERIPDVRLQIAIYDVPNPALQPFYASLEQAARGYGPDRVHWLGPLGKADLYRAMHEAGLYLYPTPSPGDPSFAETSCISVIEAMACGLPVVCSNRGALAETADYAGHLVEFEGPHSFSEDALARFTDAACDVLLSQNRAFALQEAGLRRAKDFAWADIAGEILAAADAILAEECADPARLARHFIRNQDIEAAKMAVAKVQIGDWSPQPSREKAAEVDEISDWLDQRYRHTETPERLAAYYAERVGPNNGHVFEGLMAAPAARFNELPFIRFNMIDRLIRQHLKLPDYAPDAPPPETTLRILDFGCSQGECPIALSNRLGAYILGIDASFSEVDRARQLAAKHAKDPRKLRFAVANEDPASWDVLRNHVEEHGRFDVLVCAECLEHLIDPIRLLTFLESLVRPGGIVVLTVPYGPWESQQPEPDRGQHLRQWEVADLVDIFGKKSNQVDRTPLSRCPVSGEILGNIVISYVADGKPLGRIDWDRKLTTQRPRQSLSASLILGGGTAHENLHWCLSAIQDVIDELVVVDCGMNAETRRIAEMYGAKLVPGESPLKIGFAAARNLGLDQCRGDWVLQIDGDERLISGASLWRYLRSNIYHSYSVPQHHLAVDAAWPPDLPGRIFRRGPDLEGRTLRFWGRLHEHAEFAVNKGAGLAMLLGDVRIAHVGYIDQETRANRYARNLPALHSDLMEHPDRELGLLVVCRDSMIQAKYLLAMQGIDFTRPGAAIGHEAATNLARDVVAIWDRHFADSTNHLANSSLEHYHEACRMLGSDVVADADRVIVVNRQGVGPAGIRPERALHFATIEHYQRYMHARVEAALAPITGEGF